MIAFDPSRIVECTNCNTRRYEIENFYMGLCPECVKDLLPDLSEEIKLEINEFKDNKREEKMMLDNENVGDIASIRNLI